MSRFGYNEGQPWSPYSGLASNSDQCQFLSTVGDFPAPFRSNNSLFDSEMSNELDTNLSGLVDDDVFSDESLLQELWPELLLPNSDSEESGGNHVIPDAHQSTCAAIENVSNLGTNLVPSVVSTSASVRCRLPNFVWLICACNRFSHAAAASLRAKVPQARILLQGVSDIVSSAVQVPEASRNVLKGVMKKKDKYVCEMRIMMKMQKEKNKLIPKVWLGTYKTQAQAALALDVGKFFLNSKETKSFFNPNSETILSKLSYLLAQPMEELVENVKRLAKHYGENGSLQNLVL